MNKIYLSDTIYLTDQNISHDAEGKPILPEFTSGILYITDSEYIASALKASNYPAAALMHAGNQNAHFEGIKYILEDLDEITDSDLELIYRRCAGIPWDILDTPRLHIRETTISDVDTFVELYSDSAISRYMDNLFPPDREREYQQQYIDNIYGMYDVGIWSVIRKEDGAIIGRMGIEYKDYSDGVELGFMLGSSYHNMGYAYEGCMAILDYALSMPDIDYVYARVHPDNYSSVKLCEKLGMTRQTCNEEMLIYKKSSRKREDAR